jgi:hypothetical protein
VLKPGAAFRCCLQVLGSGYLPELLAVIPAENLPTMFGGKSACDCTDIGPWQVRAWAGDDCCGMCGSSAHVTPTCTLQSWLLGRTACHGSQHLDEVHRMPRSLQQLTLYVVMCAGVPAGRGGGQQ